LLEVLLPLKEHQREFPLSSPLNRLQVTLQELPMVVELLPIAHPLAIARLQHHLQLVHLQQVLLEQELVQQEVLQQELLGLEPLQLVLQQVLQLVLLQQETQQPGVLQQEDPETHLEQQD